MKSSLYMLPLGALLALPATVQGQNELSNFSATGRGGVINTFAQGYQAIGINPANLGRPSEATVAFTLAESGGGLASRTLSKTLLKHVLFDAGQTISPAEKNQLVQGLEGKNTLNFNVDVTTFGISVSLPSGLGGVAFSNRQRVASHVALNRNAADVIVNGQDAASMQPYYPTTATGTATLPPPSLSTFLNGTAIQLAWTSEYNLSYGVQVLDLPGLKLSAGAGYRYIQGVGIVDIRVEEGDLSAYTALSPIFQINYGKLANDPQFNSETGLGLSPVGRGNGFDLGVAAEVGKMARLGVSVTDMGSMTWTGNVVTASDQKLQATSSTGIENYNVLKGIADQFDPDKTNLFTYQAARTHTAALPAKLRLGAGVRVSNFLEAAIDVTAPLNKVAGNLTSPFVGVGVDYKPLRWVRLSSGLSGGSGYGAGLPLGVALVTPVWEAGISSRDITGYFSEKSPYYSIAMGFLRFKIGSKEE